MRWERLFEWTTWSVLGETSPARHNPAMRAVALAATPAAPQRGPQPAASAVVVGQTPLVTRQGDGAATSRPLGLVRSGHGVDTSTISALGGAATAERCRGCR